MKRLAPFALGVFLAACPALMQAQPLIDVVEVASRWDRVRFTGDSLGYGIFERRIDSTRTDRVVLYYNDRRVPTAWRAMIDGQEYVHAPGFGVFAITDSVRIAQAVLQRYPNVLDALEFIGLIEQRTGAVRDP